MLSRENLKLAGVAVFCLLIAWAGPSVAHGVHAKFAHNADKVDGKHAVAAGASLNRAKKKLVAHDNKGQLPAKFIPKSFVTEGEYNQRPGTRLIAGGTVSSAGAKPADYYQFGIWSVAAGGAGVYTVSFRAPGACAQNVWPSIQLTRFSTGEISFGGISRDCATGIHSYVVVTANSAGTPASTWFSVNIYAPGSTVGPAPRAIARRGGDVECRLGC